MTNVGDSIGTGLVLLDKKGDIGVVTLNRGEKRNAMSHDLQSDLRLALEICTEMKVVIITGAAPAFCAGVDLHERRDERAAGRRTRSQGGNEWFGTLELIRKHPAIFIAAVNGIALGGGLTLVHNCELAVASESAEFGMPELSFGAVPALAGPSSVHRMASKHAAQMIFTAKRFKADEAYRMGVVNSVVSVDKLLSATLELAETVAQYDALALDHTKKAFRESAHLSWSEAIDFGITEGALVRAERSAAKS